MIEIAGEQSPESAVELVWNGTHIFVLAHLLGLYQASTPRLFSIQLSGFSSFSHMSKLPFPFWGIVRIRMHYLSSTLKGKQQQTNRGEKSWTQTLVLQLKMSSQSSNKSWVCDVFTYYSEVRLCHPQSYLLPQPSAYTPNTHSRFPFITTTTTNPKLSLPSCCS